jgi:hypothetical protein
MPGRTHKNGVRRAGRLPQDLANVVPVGRVDGVAASRALNEAINGGEVTDDEIPVGIQTLLDHLGGDNQAALTLHRSAVLAKHLQYLAFGVQAVAQGKAGVEEGELAGRELAAEYSVGFQGIGYRITNPADAFSSGERCLDGCNDLRLVTQVIDGDGTLYVTSCGDEGRIRTIGANAMPGSDQWVRDFNGHHRRFALASDGKRAQQRPFHTLRQRCGEQDGAATRTRMKGQQVFQDTLHVGVAGVDLIHHENFAEQAKQS